MEQWQEAKQCFLNAVAANPNHTDALRLLGEAHHILGEPHLAEKLLKDAAKLDPNCPRVWLDHYIFTHMLKCWYINVEFLIAGFHWEKCWRPYLNILLLQIAWQLP